MAVTYDSYAWYDGFNMFFLLDNTPINYIYTIQSECCNPKARLFFSGVILAHNLLEKHI